MPYCRESFNITTIKKLHGLSPRAKYTDRATAAFRRSECQPLRIEGDWSRVPDGHLTPRRIGQLTVGRNVALTLT
jgi:hypothetical protein